jgi:hypothetical protein
MPSFIHREEPLSEASADKDYLQWLADDASDAAPDDRGHSRAGRDETTLSSNDAGRDRHPV